MARYGCIRDVGERHPRHGADLRCLEHYRHAAIQQQGMADAQLKDLVDVNLAGQFDGLARQSGMQSRRPVLTVRPAHAALGSM